MAGGGGAGDTGRQGLAGVKMLGVGDCSIIKPNSKERGLRAGRGGVVRGVKAMGAAAQRRARDVAEKEGRWETHGLRVTWQEGRPRGRPASERGSLAPG